MAIKSESLMVHISPEVKAILTEKSTALGMTMSEYVRLLILEDTRKISAAP
jgi:antitoxin component of RelBE/YafQ-DinJ toxin-antitoxin module